jgi:hypothetical protein
MTGGLRTRDGERAKDAKGTEKPKLNTEARRHGEEKRREDNS